MPLTKAQLQEFLSEQGVMPLEGMMIADGQYSLPDWRWVTNDFAPATGRLISGLGFNYTPESSDCDDFARLVAAHAGLTHRFTANLRTGLAFGEFWYTQRTGGGHAINAAVVKEGGKYLLRFMEPQTQREVKLEKEEIQSCLGARF